jgi:hypothetical protein
LRNKKLKRVLKSAVLSLVQQMKRERSVSIKTNSPTTSQLMSASIAGTLRQGIMKEELTTISITKRAKMQLLSIPTSTKRDPLKEQTIKRSVDHHHCPNKHKLFQLRRRDQKKRDHL